jgi:hypothetical protein
LDVLAVHQQVLAYQQSHLQARVVLYLGQIVWAAELRHLDTQAVQPFRRTLPSTHRRWCQLRSRFEAVLLGPVAALVRVVLSALSTVVHLLVVQLLAPHQEKHSNSRMTKSHSSSSAWMDSQAQSDRTTEA